MDNESDSLTHPQDLSNIESNTDQPSPSTSTVGEIISSSANAADVPLTDTVDDNVTNDINSLNETGGDNDEEESTGGAQTLVVNKLIKIISRVRTENALLELQISDSAKHNKLLQLQIDIMMRKMEVLEGFMAQVRQMDDDENRNDNCNRNLEDDEVQSSPQVCRRCKKKINKQGETEKGNHSPDLSDSDDVDVHELMSMWDGDYSDNDHGVQNPLLIDVVVGNVMEHLPIPTLLKCRLVNHLWYKEATYELKQRQTLTINRDNIDKLPKMFDLTPSTSSKPSSFDAFPFSGKFLFRKVKFEIGFLVKSYRDILEQFFTKYGCEIHNFSLHCEQENSSILYTEEVRNIFLPFLKNVKVLELSVPTKITERQTMYDDIRPKKFMYDQLTTLKLRQMDVSLDVGGYSVAVVKELLKTGPNLRSLGIETHTKEVVTRVLQALNDKECRNVVNQLSELYLDAFVTEEHLMLLLPLDFKLKTLQISYCTVDVSSAMLEAMLCKQRTTLQTLILGDYQKRTTPNSLPLILKLPTMRELKLLKFVDPLFPDHRQILLNPLSYSEQLPALVELCFEHETGKPTGPHYFQDVFVCPPSCSTLTTLSISHGLADPQLVSAAAKMFPNLKTLQIAGATDVVIQAVWREFTGIKTLYLIFNPSNLNIDSLMTGIPDQVCRRIQERNLFSQVDVMNALDIIRTEAAICNLSELQTLRIDGFTSSLITAVTGYLAFCHMKSLTSISIKSDIVTFSRECQRVLGEKLHLSLLEMF